MMHLMQSWMRRIHAYVLCLRLRKVIQLTSSYNTRAYGCNVASDISKISTAIQYLLSAVKDMVLGMMQKVLNKLRFRDVAANTRFVLRATATHQSNTQPPHYSGSDPGICRTNDVEARKGCYFWVPSCEVSLAISLSHWDMEWLILHGLDICGQRLRLRLTMCLTTSK